VTGGRGDDRAHHHSTDGGPIVPEWGAPRRVPIDDRACGAVHVPERARAASRSFTRVEREQGGGHAQPPLRHAAKTCQGVSLSIDGMTRVLLLLAAYYVWYAARVLPPLRAALLRVDARLCRRAGSPSMADLRRRPIARTAYLKRCWARGDYMAAYEAFWAGWNPAPRAVMRAVYEAVGGNRRPVRSTLVTFASSGLVHLALLPALPLWILTLVLTARFLPPHQEDIVSHWACAVIPLSIGAWVLLGAPVLLAKGLRRDRGAHQAWT